MSNYGLRKNKSSCGSSNQRYDPYMLGGSRGYAVSRMPQTMNTVNTPPPAPQQYLPPNRSASLYDANATVRDCMFWPASLNNRSGMQAQAPQTIAYANTPSNNAGDSQYCSAPPKVYISGPGGKGMRPQNIPCQIAPLGTDPSSLIKPLQPLTVRVQAPPDLFTGNPSEPKTISISPAQLYGTGGR